MYTTERPLSILLDYIVLASHINVHGTVGHANTRWFYNVTISLNIGTFTTLYNSHVMC